MFRVYENGKLADCFHFPVDRSWMQSPFKTFAEAVKYAKDWLGQWNSLPDNWDGKPYDYSGCGSVIEIREED